MKLLKKDIINCFNCGEPMDRWHRNPHICDPEKMRIRIHNLDKQIEDLRSITLGELIDAICQRK